MRWRGVSRHLSDGETSVRLAPPSPRVGDEPCAVAGFGHHLSDGETSVGLASEGTVFAHFYSQRNLGYKLIARAKDKGNAVVLYRRVVRCRDFVRTRPEDLSDNVRPFPWEGHLGETPSILG